MIRVVILGYGPMGLALARGVLAGPELATIVGVYPWSFHPTEAAYAQERSEHRFRQFIQQHRLPLIEAGSVNAFGFTETLLALQPDLVLVGSWGEIFKSHVLQLPGIRFLNCHPSLLPLHRGPNPYVAALLAGDATTGVTFHVMDEGIDTGPIVMQAQLAIYPHDTGESLRERCAQLTEQIIPLLLQAFEQNVLTQVPQPQEGLYDRFDVSMCHLPWREPPEAIERRIRALYPWYETTATLGRFTVKFHFGRMRTYPSSFPPPPAEPGIILRASLKDIWVSTTDPRHGLCLEHPRIHEVPRLLSPLLVKFLLRPGQRFDSPA